MVHRDILAHPQRADARLPMPLAILPAVFSGRRPMHTHRMHSCLRNPMVMCRHWAGCFETG